jgi:hypothetical protein
LYSPENRITATSYTLSAWVYPVSGEQRFELVTGWDRGGGNDTYQLAVDFTPTQTKWGAAPVVAPAPALAPNAWHQFELSLDVATDSVTLYLDGVNEGTTSAGVMPPQSDATIIFGQPWGDVRAPAPADLDAPLVFGKRELKVASEPKRRQRLRIEVSMRGWLVSDEIPNSFVYHAGPKLFRI